MYRNSPRAGEMLEEVLKNHTGASEVVFDVDPNKSFVDLNILKHFIFNPNSKLIIDNDNG